MRLSPVFCAMVLCVGCLSASAQQAVPPAPDINLTAVEAVVASAEAHLAALDRLIATQEEKLDALYAQRDAADQDTRADQFDQVIDRMNLTLTHLEAERDGIAATLATLQAQITALASPAPDATEE